MKLIKADHDRRIAIPGVPNPVRRPVDIDRSKTGFTNLRSLRVYRFDGDSTIDGHAEEDEVFIVVMAGVVELNVSGDGSPVEPRPQILTAANSGGNSPCVAYLPPHSAYQLIPKTTEAAIAYARATPDGGPPSEVFTASGSEDAPGVTVLLQEEKYARRLRLKLLQVNTQEDSAQLPILYPLESAHEALVHVQTTPVEGVTTLTAADREPIQLASWDTAAVAPGTHPVLHIDRRSSALVLIVLAT